MPPPPSVMRAAATDANAGVAALGKFLAGSAVLRRHNRHRGRLRFADQRLDIELCGGGFHEALRIARDLGRDEIRPVQGFAQLPGGDVAGFLVRPLVDLPAHDAVRAGRAGVEAFGRPHHPFAVRAAEQGDEQLARLEVPQPHRLVVRARDEKAAIGRGRDGPDIALMAHEIAELVARAVIGGEHAIAAARDDGFAIGRETIGPVPIAIRGVAGDGGNRAPVLRDVENGVVAIGAALSMAKREAAKAGLRAAEGAGLCLGKRNRRAKRALAQRQGQCLLERVCRDD